MPSLRTPVAAAVIVALAGAALAVSLGASLPVVAVLLASAAASGAAMWTMGGAPAVAPVAPPPEPPLPLPRNPEFLALIDALDDPFLLVEDGFVRAANSSARRLLGDFITGQDVRAAIRHPAAADLASDIAAANGTVALSGLGAAGDRWSLAWRTLPDGQRGVTLTDISAREAVERMRADFVANASHELRTPLSAVIGFIETLRDTDAGADPATRARFLGIAETEARRMQRLVEDLMSISRVEGATGTLPDDVIDLSDLARTVEGEQRATGDARAADIRVEATTAATVRGDRALLSQMLHNLVSNAMKYGRPGTPVTVGVDAAILPGSVVLTIRDEGEGIAPVHLPRLTERFYRVDSARSRELGGTGLGLAIVRHIVARHGGRLEIDSEQGVGTIVSVRLPAAEIADPA